MKTIKTIINIDNMKQKLIALAKSTVEFIKECLEFIAMFVACTFLSFMFWTLVGVAYVGSAMIVGQWLKIVLKYMN